MSKVKTIQFQFALFFDSIEKRPDKLASKVEDALDEIFDQMPTILPIPPDAPADIPTVIMQSSNGIYTCNIARGRIDLIVNNNNRGELNLENFIKLIHSFSTAVYNFKNITRFGFIARYFCKHIDPVTVIKSKYFKSDLDNLEELSIRFNKRFENNSITYNDVVEIGQNTIDENGVITSGVFIQRDVNNVPVAALPLEEVLAVITLHQDKFSENGILELIE